MDAEQRAVWAGLRPSASPKETVEQLLSRADIRIGGLRPWDVTVHNETVFARSLAEGRLGLGESYMDGWWGCAALDQFFHRLISASLYDQVSRWSLLIPYLRARLGNGLHRRHRHRVAEVHYDLGNELFEAMLDRRMVYSCGYWKDASTLDEAQEHKLDLICRKIGLESGMKVLDIGCGWGSFARYASERYGAEVVGITVSKEQVALGRKQCEGLPVEILLQDYRDLEGVYDRIVSIGMFEHIGSANYRLFMETVHRCLRGDDSLFLLHTIGGRTPVVRPDPWLYKYIFPDSVLPTAAQIAAAAQELFVIEDWHNFGADYDKTLMVWRQNFEEHWPELAPKYGERFHRTWHYFLSFSAGTFRSRYNQLWQIVMTRKGIPGGYTCIR